MPDDPTDTRLVARRAEPRDRATLARWYGDPVLQAVLEDEPPSPRRLRRKIDQLIACNPVSDGQYAVILERASRPVAFIHFMYINWIGRTAEIDFLLDPRGGYPPSLLVAVLRRMGRIAFSELNLHKVYAFIYGSNQRSGRLLRRLLHFEATCRAYRKRPDGYEDVYVAGMLDSDYKALIERHGG